MGYMKPHINQPINKNSMAEGSIEDPSKSGWFSMRFVVGGSFPSAALHMLHRHKAAKNMKRMHTAPYISNEGGWRGKLVVDSRAIRASGTDARRRKYGGNFPATSYGRDFCPHVFYGYGVCY